MTGSCMRGSIPGMSAFMSEAVDRYLTERAQSEHGDALLVEMEARAKEHGFPIVGRASGRYLELAARSIQARRVMELGSGYGYSAYWFTRAVGPTGHVVCTDGSQDNRDLAEGYLTRAGVWDRVTYRVGDALEGFAQEDGEFDVVYCDVDKGGYPDCWRAARDRVRVGGLYLCDNTLWDGRVADGSDRPGMEGRGWTAAIVEHNHLVAEDPRYVSSIVPIRDGILVALRIS